MILKKLFVTVFILLPMFLFMSFTAHAECTAMWDEYPHEWITGFHFYQGDPERIRVGSVEDAAATQELCTAIGLTPELPGPITMTAYRLEGELEQESPESAPATWNFQAPTFRLSIEVP